MSYLPAPQDNDDVLFNVEKRVRAEWPGTRMNRNGEIFTAPEIRPGGATERFLEIMLKIVREELGHV